MLRLLRIALGALLALCITSAYAQTERNATAHIDPLGYCQLSVAGATAISTCSSGIPQRTVWAEICIETAATRWRDDGTNPTTTVGMPLLAGQCLNYVGSMSALVFIAQSGTATVNISFYAGSPRV